ncbi:MAG: carboxylating nicotinate-nucleotide diphosphorylase [Thermoplasmata archaeon]|nr:carboxylating nicotinate-nucleotide diphosphorylase [Thermoplasmata archaeon]
MDSMPEDMSRFLAEDIGQGDITTDSVIGDHDEAVGQIKAKSKCIVSGLSEAEQVFKKMGLSVEVLGKEGSEVHPGDIVMKVTGPAKPMLTAERLALNFIMLMSGIATTTRTLVDKAREVNPNVRVAGTRKTTPGFRRYAKKAIITGGGDPHRFRLDDGILIKDNHLKIVGSITEAVSRAKHFSFSKKIEVEVETLAQAKEAALAGADLLLLDNMTTKQVAEASKIVKDINSKALIEVSGGIRPDTIASYAEYADVISVGYITHSAPAADFSMDIRKP